MNKNVDFKMVYACLYANRKTIMQISNTEYNLWDGVTEENQDS
jgi:hypothetical protein